MRIKSQNTQTVKEGDFSLYPNNPTYLTTEEAGAILRVGTRTVGLYVAKHGLKAARIGKRLLITRSDLDCWIETRAAKTV